MSNEFINIGSANSSPEQFQLRYISIVALRTKRKIFSYKIQKPLLKRNLKKDV